MIDLLLSVVLTAHTACLESGRRYDDAEAVAQVAVNRARNGGVPLWRVYDSSWNAGMPRACGYPLTVEHYAIGVRAAFGALSAPKWAGSAVAFVSRRRECEVSGNGEIVAHRWRRRGLRPIGTVVHVFYGLRPTRQIRRSCGGR